MKKSKVGLIGRSNVGKSTLLNKLLGRNLAKISKKPGRTRKHTIYQFNNTLDLIDLPGYGYAKISKERRAIWDELLLSLIHEDNELVCMGCLIDISIKPQKIDMIFIEYLIEKNIKFILIFNKIDKEKQNVINQNLKEWNNFVDLGAIDNFLISAKTGIGISQLRQYFQLIN